MRAFALLQLLLGGLAVRNIQRRSESERWPWPTTTAPPKHSFETVTNRHQGPCSSYFGTLNVYLRPVSFPVTCSAEAAGVVVRVNVTALWVTNLTFTVDGRRVGFVQTLYPAVWNVTVGSLPSGLSYLGMKMAGQHWGEWSRDEISSVQLVGTSGDCSFTEVPPARRDASANTYKGFDAMYRLFGSDRDFPAWQKDDLYFVSETVGKTRDGSIDASVVTEGWNKWMVEFSQNQPSDDQWGHRGVLWNESNIRPYLEARLEPLPGRSGQKMVVQEPCNALSAYCYHQAAVWMSCKGYPFDEEELASLLAAFNSLTVGTIFQHACACSIGEKADLFAMDWLMLQIHQVAVKQVVSNADAHLTEEEKATILVFNKNFGAATDMAKNLTRLFEQKYDHAAWNAAVRSFDVPDFMFSIVGFVSFVLNALQDLIGEEIKDLLDALLDALIQAFDVPDPDFWMNKYTPAVRKALKYSTLCEEAIGPVVEVTVKFLLTFVEALIYQEQTLHLPQEIKDILKNLDDLGLTHSLMTDMADSWDYYNGQDCLARSDHAVWHEKAGHGLIHFLNAAEYFRTSVGC